MMTGMLNFKQGFSAMIVLLFMFDLYIFCTDMLFIEPWSSPKHHFYIIKLLYYVRIRGRSIGFVPAIMPLVVALNFKF